MATFVWAQSYKDIALKWQKEYPAIFGGLDVARIAFVKEIDKGPKKKGRVVYADTRKLSQLFKLLNEDYDFIITFHQQEIENAQFNEAQKNILVGHEIWHIDPDDDKLRNHDVEDFALFIKGFGVGWAKDKNVKDPFEHVIKELSGV